ncbi:MAG: endonuclease/exonuclease/phosphatase family protein [Planctomycetes bacterium]|nr:endonuclease/exonuclease/phosphatase family protein [Planctomycetota bacterium]
MTRLLASTVPFLVASLAVACHLRQENGETTRTSLLPIAQSAPGTELTFAFWNVENLFDSEDDPSNAGDDEYLPAREWTPERYALKLDHVAGEIKEVAPHVIGFAEVENQRVLDDLVAQPALAGQSFTVVHRESPDPRGIDVALAFRAPFELDGGDDAVVLHPVRRASGPSRSVLEVRLRAGDARLVVFVNHWPSRGSDRDGSFRAVAGAVCKAAALAAIEREKAAGRDADVLIVGDFNDDPWDASIVTALGAVRSRNAALNRRDGTPLWNASWPLLATPDLGTLYYNPEWTWNVFDQCILSRGMLDATGFTYVDGSLHVHAPDKLRDDLRRPKWFRRGRGGKWDEGYSDHFMIAGRLITK